jgi:hypothetical protein
MMAPIKLSSGNSEFQRLAGIGLEGLREVLARVGWLGPLIVHLLCFPYFSRSDSVEQKNDKDLRHR